MCRERGHGEYFEEDGLKDKFVSSSRSGTPLDKVLRSLRSGSLAIQYRAILPHDKEYCFGYQDQEAPAVKQGDALQEAAQKGEKEAGA